MVQCQPHAHRAGLGERLGLGLHQCPRAADVALEPKLRGAGGEPAKMAFEVAHALAAADMHGLEQLEAGVEPGQEAGLQRALLEFLGGAAVDRDAGADAETPPPGAGVAAGQRQRADRHRQAEVTAGTPGRRGVEPADGAGVEAPRRVFEGSDDLHRAVLRCSGDRSAREKRPHQIREAGAGR